MLRIIEPELLDSLPPNDPRAVRSRRDLGRINAWMANARAIARAIRELRHPPRRILELGAGDGTLFLKIARGRPDSLPSRITLYLLDMEPVIASETLASYRELGWQAEIIKMNLRDWIQRPDPAGIDLIVANLFLHHFSGEELQRFFAGFAKVGSAFISCDPRRWIPAAAATRFLWLLGCNDVTRYDAKVSVRAGFRERELTALWPRESGFALHERSAGYASHLFIAQPADSPPRSPVPAQRASAASFPGLSSA